MLLAHAMNTPADTSYLTLETWVCRRDELIKGQEKRVLSLSRAAPLHIPDDEGNNDLAIALLLTHLSASNLPLLEAYLGIRT